MKKGIIASLLLVFPTALLADIVVYAPASYTCAPQGDQCVCTQKESSVFPQSVNLQNDCNGQPTFTIKFATALLNKGTSSKKASTTSGPGLVHAIYDFGGGSGLGVTSKSIMTVSTDTWSWTPLAYRCKGTTPQDCPMTVWSGRTNKY